MDMKKECMIPESGPWPDFTGKKILVGSKQLRKALKNDRVAAVFLAENADPRLTWAWEVARYRPGCSDSI